jgi:hypothetical protein
MLTISREPKREVSNMGTAADKQKIKKDIQDGEDHAKKELNTYGFAIAEKMLGTLSLTEKVAKANKLKTLATNLAGAIPIPLIGTIAQKGIDYVAKKKQDRPTLDQIADDYLFFISVFEDTVASYAAAYTELHKAAFNAKGVTVNAAPLFDWTIVGYFGHLAQYYADVMEGQVRNLKNEQQILENQIALARQKIQSVKREIQKDTNISEEDMGMGRAEELVRSRSTAVVNSSLNYIINNNNNNNNTNPRRDSVERQPLTGFLTNKK